MDPLGDQLLQIVRGARQECFLVAPYIKRATIERLLSAVQSACLVRVVTRWRLDEIALGVSDLEVWDALVERSNSELWLQPSLHAKYYRADDCVAIGSANLTHTALGWGPSPNLEILYDMGETFADRGSFEATLFKGALKVDLALYESFVSALEAFPPPPPRPSTVEVSISAVAVGDWRPSLRFPENLFMLYNGDEEVLSSAARDAAAGDLSALDPPIGLSEEQFKNWIKLALLQHSEFRAIDDFVSSSRRFGEMRDFLAARGAEDGNRAWQTWMRWILFFLPDRLRFHTANYSEIVSRPIARDARRV